MKTKLAALAAIGLAVSACGESSPSATNPQALAHGAAVKTLAAGKLDALPTGPVYIRIVRFVSPSGYVIHSKQHVPSFVYVETGVHELTLAGQQPVDLAAGQAVFHQSVTHTHLNPGPDSSVWYSIAVWPSSARGTAPVDKIAQAVFESTDIVRDVLPDVAYSLVLRQVTLAVQGTAGAHRFGGLAAFYVLSGSVTINAEHRSPLTLGAGQGSAFLPNVPLQEVNAGPGQAAYLEFITTATGNDFEVPLQQPPSTGG